jgi:hypothetical protein
MKESGNWEKLMELVNLYGQTDKSIKAITRMD